MFMPLLNARLTLIQRFGEQTRRHNMQFTLWKLFLAVTMLALACAGLTFHSEGWASGIMSLTFLLYVAAAVRAICLQGRQRAVALSFLLAGVAYLTLVFTNIAPAVRSAMIANDLLEAAYRVVPKSLSEASPGFAPSYPWHHLDWLFGDGMEGEPRRHFVVIGHSVASWFLALLAASFAGEIYARRESSSKA
jgi:hypothetical protein